MYAKRKYKRRTVRRPKKSNSLSVSKVKQLVKQGINKRAEKKSVDIDHSTAAYPTVTTPLVYNDFCEVAQGDTSSTRDGSSIQAQNLVAKYQVSCVAGSGPAEILRVLWVWIEDDTMDTGLLADFNALTINGFLPRYQDQKYKVLSDKRIVIDTVTSIDTKMYTQSFKLNKKITYASSSASIERGELSCFFICQNNTTTNTSVKMNARLYYYDM